MVRYLHGERWFAEHRSEDTLLIAEVIRAHKPLICVELGTRVGGFAAFLADTVAPWGGVVHTFDVKRQLSDGLLEAFPNLRFHEADVLVEHPAVVELVRSPGALLYTDNGDKETELATYAPHLPVGALLGTHDYVTEVRPEIVEPLLLCMGYQPHRHEDFEALADPPGYPVSLTRFWQRVRQ